MMIKFNNWKSIMCEWAESNKGDCKIIKHISVGSVGDSFTIEVNIDFRGINSLIISQNGGGTNIEVVLSYLMFEHSNKEMYNFNLSLYQKGIFEKLFNIGKIKTGNVLFDKKFGIFTSDKKTAAQLFKDEKIQQLFLNNKFLLLNIQKSNSQIFLKSMESKLYKETELQFLLESFIYILKKIKAIKAQ